MSLVIKLTNISTIWCSSDCNTVVVAQKLCCCMDGCVPYSSTVTQAVLDTYCLHPLVQNMSYIQNWLIPIFLYCLSKIQQTVWAMSPLVPQLNNCGLCYFQIYHKEQIYKGQLNFQLEQFQTLVLIHHVHFL